MFKEDFSLSYALSNWELGCNRAMALLSSLQVLCGGRCIQIPSTEGSELYPHWKLALPQRTVLPKVILLGRTILQPITSFYLGELERWFHL